MSRIIVKNLPSTITEKKLRDIFEEKGFITDLQLKYNKAGVFRKFAFIGYKTEEEAKAAKEHLNNTFVFTSKIQIEICSNLNDPSKPKPWKEFLKEKALIKEEQELRKKSKKEKRKSSKANDDDDIPEELKNDSKFKEFLAVHEDRKTKPLWADEAGALEDESGSSSSGDEGYDTVHKDESKQEQPIPEVKSKNAKKEKSSKKGEEVQTQDSVTKVKVYADLYTVKVRNLPLRFKKKKLKELFHPLKITSLRLAPKRKGFAYVSFKTEKDMNIALIKDKGFVGDHRIRVVKYTRKENPINKSGVKTEQEKEKDLELLVETGRIYVRNLCYSVTESEIEGLFSKYGLLEEVLLPVDLLTKKAQGFAFVTFVLPENAVKAFSELDGTIFQGRLLHLIPSEPKKEIQIDENETNYKKKKQANMKALSGSSHNWNILFMNMNAVADVISEKYKIDKMKLLISHQSNDSAAVRMALAETQVVQENRKFLIDNGVQLDAFSQAAAERSKTVIIVKHLPAKTTHEELNELFSKHGTISRIILPPLGMVAIVEFQDPTEAKAAFKKLAYTRFHVLPLYLEWAPINAITDPLPCNPDDDLNKSPEKEGSKSAAGNNSKTEAGEEPPDGTTIFVKNLNFDTTQESFKKHFEKCGPVHYASISTKKDLKTGKLLSMGFGFVQYKNKSSAAKAIQTLQLSKLDSRSLELKYSTRSIGASSKSERKKYEIKQQESAKILVRNLPFKATKKEVTDLFREFGTLKYVRLPKKMGFENKNRGFGFVEYMTKCDAKNAFNILCHSTHLYGRRLVLEWANTDSEDVAELRKKTARDFAESVPAPRVKKSKLQEDVALASARFLSDD